MSTASSPTSKLKPALITGGALLTLAAIFVFDPRQFPIFPRCLFHSMTGLHCPGCGALRGLYELAHGHLLTAIGMNPLVFIGLPALIAFHLLKKRRRQEGIFESLLARPVFAWSALAVVVLFWILRNLPFYPFTLLAP